MEFVGIIKDEKGELHIQKPKIKFKLFGSPEISSTPQIILTKDEVKERGLLHMIPEKVGFRDKYFNHGMKCVAYTEVDRQRVPILLKE